MAELTMEAIALPKQQAEVRRRPATYDVRAAYRALYDALNRGQA